MLNNTASNNSKWTNMEPYLKMQIFKDVDLKEEKPNKKPQNTSAKWKLK